MDEPKGVGRSLGTVVDSASGVTLVPLLALGVIALAGLGDTTTAGGYALAASAWIIAALSLLLLVRAAGSKAGQGGTGKAEALLSGTCVFALGVSLGIACLPPGAEPDPSPPGEGEWMSLPMATGRAPEAGPGIADIAPGPGPVVAHLERGLELHRAGDAEGAAAAYERALALCDEDPGADPGSREEALARLVVVLREADRHDDALAAIESQLDKLDKAVGRAPSAVAEWYEEAGRLLGMSDRAEESARRFERALALRDEDPSGDRLKAAYARVNLSISYNRLGLSKQAERELHAALEVMRERLPAGHDARLAAQSLLDEIAGQVPK